MKLPGIEWDEPKARDNITNHHLSFDVAQYALFDPERLERVDHSESNTTTENRWQVLGKVGKIIFAIYEDKGQVKRLISAWFAEKQERRVYNGYYEEGYENWYHDT
ncbi:MAG TPA: hypothetical protein DEQ14_01010 [Treponema sp.]|nr:hypothetical protein [Treponema sp.]